MAIMPNYDYDTANADLARRQAIVDRLTAASMQPQPFQYQGAVAPRANPLSAVANIVQFLAGQKASDDLSQQRADLTSRYKDDLANGLQQFMRTSNGYTETTPASPNTDVSMAAPTQVYHPGDQKQAVIDAMASGHPVLQQLGQQMLPTVLRMDPFSKLLQTLSPGQGGNPPGGGVSPSPDGSPVPAPGQPAASGDALSRLAPHVDRITAMGLLAADPTGKTLMEAELKNSQPIAGREGGIYTRNPDGSVTLAPGFTAGAKEIALGKNAVENANTLVDTTDPNSGAPVKMTKTQAIANATGGGEEYPGASLIAQIPEADRKALLNDAKQSGQYQFDLKYMLPSGKMLVGPVDLTGASTAHGAQPAASGGFVAGQSPALQAEQKAYGEGLAKTSNDINEAADSAMSVKARLAEMAKATQNFQSGALQPYKGALGSLMIAFGADPANVDKQLGSVSDWQSFNKEATQLAFDRVRQLGSREAAQVVQMAMKNAANDSLQPGANVKIMGVMDGMADWQIARQQAAQAWRDAHHGSLDGFQTYFNQTTPIGPFIEAAQARMPAPKGLPTSPVDATRPTGSPAPRVIRFEDLPNG
jgi:hypothetical protein